MGLGSVMSSVSSVSAEGADYYNFPRVTFMSWPASGDCSTNSRLIPDQSMGTMSPGVVTQGNVTYIDSRQSPGVGGQVSSCMGEAPMQMTQVCPK